MPKTGGKNPQKPLKRKTVTLTDRRLKIELEREEDGRWLAVVVDLPGVMAYGKTKEGASTAAQKIALEVIADRIEHGERVPELANLFSIVA